MLSVIMSGAELDLNVENGQELTSTCVVIDKVERFSWKKEKPVRLSLNKPEYSLMNETEVLMLAKGGDLKALEYIFEIHSGKLKNFIKKNSYDHTYLEDLMQETYLQAIVGLNGFKRGSTFSTWLLGIAYNLLRNHYNRSPQYKYTLTSADVLEEHASDLLTPEQYMEQFDRFSELNVLYESLPDRSRKILELYAFEGRSYEDISETVGESISAIKSRLFRSRSKIRDSIEPLL